MQFLTLHAAGDTQMKLLYHFQRPPASSTALTKEVKGPGQVPQASPAKPTARQPAGGLWRPW